jgi:hypothetical protein
MCAPRSYFTRMVVLGPTPMISPWGVLMSLFGHQLRRSCLGLVMKTSLPTTFGMMSSNLCLCRCLNFFAVTANDSNCLAIARSPSRIDVRQAATSVPISPSSMWLPWRTWRCRSTCHCMMASRLHSTQRPHTHRLIYFLLMPGNAVPPHRQYWPPDA